MLRHLASSVPCIAFETYQPCKTLLMYGWGGHEQQKAAHVHQGQLACFDLGYWSRTGLGERHWRVAVGGWHCPSLIDIGASEHRFQRYGLKVHKAKFNPDGPILVVGSSLKTQKVGGRGWSRKMIGHIQKRTDKEVWYKVKLGKNPEPGIDVPVVQGDIFDVLPKVSMVVCRHSNVAVDAAFYGVPVVCEDGAGAAIYPNTLDGLQPSYEERLKFLHNVAWWQWSTHEIQNGDCWRWLRKRLED